MTQPVYTVIDAGPRGKLVMCEHNGEVGTARVFSKGVQDACDRAFEQAQAKVRERAAS